MTEAERDSQLASTEALGVLMGVQTQIIKALNERDLLDGRALAELVGAVGVHLQSKSAREFATSYQRSILNALDPAPQAARPALRVVD